MNVGQLMRALQRVQVDAEIMLLSEGALRKVQVVSTSENEVTVELLA